jgi:glycosyltransferase involved in cell wall biosynthesis
MCLTRSLIRVSRTGLLVEYNDVPGFSGAIVSVLTNPTLARQLGENGRKHVQTEFNEYMVADRVEEIYNHVLNDKPGTLPHWIPTNGS